MKIGASIGKWSLLYCGPSVTSLLSLPVSRIVPSQLSARHLKMASSGNGDFGADSVQRWEELYYAGDSDKSTSIISVPSTTCPVRVVTFDLDNTLWNTTITIDVANDALAKYMNENVTTLLETSTASALPIRRVEKVMGTLFAANKSKYCPVDGESSKSPVFLTQLRKDAILYVIREHATISMQNCATNNRESDFIVDDVTISHFVDSAFDLWTNSRHTAISSHMVPSATHVLQQIQALPTPHGAQKIVIGAITDGNSDPGLIPELAQYFDFCINAEMIGVSKPNKRIYLEAVARAIQDHPSLHDLLPSSFEQFGRGEMSAEWTDDQLEDLVGPWWVHIGDDFVKDIVASKSLNMRSIWTKELILDKLLLASDKTASPQRTVEELMLVVNEQKVVEMPIGADNYLADSLQQEFADAVVHQLQDVVEIIQKWQSEALSVLKTTEKVEDIVPLQNTQAVSSSELNFDGSVAVKTTKFCFLCGTKLPMVAKFCTTCGEQQSV